MEQSIDFLDGVEASSAPLFATLYGFRETVKQVLGIEKFPLVMHNDHKGSVRKAYGNADMPYGYFRITNIVVNEDSQAPATIARVGAGRFVDKMNALVKMSYIFAVDITVECFYRDTDPSRVLSFVSNLALVNVVDGLDFTLNLPSGDRTVKSTPDQKGAAVPQVDKDDEANPGVSEVSFGYTVRGFAGVYKPVAKVNNDGIVTLQSDVGGTETVAKTPAFNKPVAERERPMRPKPPGG